MQINIRKKKVLYALTLTGILEHEFTLNRRLTTVNGVVVSVFCNAATMLNIILKSIYARTREMIMNY